MKILKQIDINDVVFIDIETVKAEKQLIQGTPLWEAWQYKNKSGRDPIGANDIVKSFDEQASLYAEFGKIVCITIGKVKGETLKLKSYAVDDEKQLLSDFAAALEGIVAANKKTILCGHAIKGFDIPWIVRRCIVHQVELPNILDLNHLKPWEMTSILDTMEIWKGGAFNGASLIAIAVALGIANPKDELEGSETSTTYYNEQYGLGKIQAYCEKDVATVAQIFRKCRYEPLLEVELGEIKVKQVGVLNKVFNKGAMAPAEEKEIVANYNKLEADEKVIAKEILEAVKTK